MVDILEMKQRVAATEEKIKAATEKGEQQGKRLLDLLQEVEANLLHKQSEITALRAEQALAKDEIGQLRDMLQATLSLAETSKETRPSLPNHDLENLLTRLNQIVESAGQDLDELFLPSGTLAADDPKPVDPPKKKRRGKGFKKVFS